VSAAGLPALAARAAVPGYDRRQASVGVVHVGVGNFHRAHQALYLDRLMEQTGDLTWGICGVGVLAGDRAMQEALAAQDGLYTVVEKHGDGRQDVRVVGSLLEYLLVPDDPEAVLERMADPAIRLVTLTITEGAYGEENDDRAGASPWTAFALIAEALRRRRDRGIAPFAVASCDNVEANGRLTRARLTAAARHIDQGLADWVERDVPVPSSMVDRITSATTDAHRSELLARHGIADRRPVVCEPYTQWVLEDVFADRPPLEEVGVQLVDDVAPYELMKLRLLNGAHQVLCYLAYLAGHRLVHEAVQDPPFRALLRGYTAAEAAPTLPRVPGVDLGDYASILLERFANAGVQDTVARLCTQGSDRLPRWLLPVVRHQLETGGEIGHCAVAVAGWARYSEGVDEAGEPIDVVDRRRDELTARAGRQRDQPLAFLEDHELFGDLADDSRFTAAYEAALASLLEHGARATVLALAGAPVHTTTSPEAP